MPSARRGNRWARLALVAALGLLLTACGGDIPQSAVDPRGPFAEQSNDLFVLVLWIAIGIFVIVQGLIVYTMVKYREKPGDESLPEQVHGNTKMEIAWTVVPALILAAIAVPTVQTIFELDGAPEGAFQAEVIGHRWWFEYRYPTQPGIEEEIVTANELVIPVGRPVRVAMTAKDPADSDRLAVIHSFWVPKLAGKQDVVPGRVNSLNFQADEPGRYLGQCAEYCGLSHANMRLRVIALPQDEFDQWVAEQTEPAAEPEPGTLAAQGKELLTTAQAGGQACASCHAIRGVDGVSGRVGPDLTHLMSRKEFAGAIFDLYHRNEDGSFDLSRPHTENLSNWLERPTEMKPMQPEFGVGMPNLELTPDEIEALVAYLVTLK